jgi:hypothetical protein
VRAEGPDDSDTRATATVETKSTTGDDEKPAATSAPASDSATPDSSKPAAADKSDTPAEEGAKPAHRKPVVKSEETEDSKPAGDSAKTESKTEGDSATAEKPAGERAKTEAKPAGDSAAPTEKASVETETTSEKKPEETEEKKPTPRETKQETPAEPAAPEQPAQPPRKARTAASAPAAHKPRVIPVTVSNSDNAGRAAARVAYIIESAVRHSRSARFDLADPLEIFDPVGTQQRGDLTVRGTDALAFGKKSYDGLEEGLGLESFDRAISAFQEGALWQNVKNYAKAEVMRILIRWADDPGGTKHEIANLLLVYPKAEFPKEQVPQDLAQEIQIQKESIANLPRATLDISSSPVPGRVYVDGIYRGTAPVSIRELPVGDHFLAVVAPGYDVSQQIVHVVPGSAVSVPLHVVDKARPYLTLVNRIGTAFDKPDEVTAAVLLGQLAGAEQVLDASVSRRSGVLTIELHRYEVKDGHNAASVTLTGLVDTDPQLATKVAEAVETALATDRPRCQKGAACDAPPPQEVDQGGDKQANGSGGRIALVTTSSILLAAGIGLTVGAHYETLAFNKVTQTDPTLPSRGNTVLATVITSQVCNGLGLIGLSVWAYLQFGLAAQQRAQNIGPSVPAENTVAPAPTQPEKPPPAQKKKEDDPFETRLDTAPQGPSFAFVAAPQPGGATFGVVGVFP